MSGNVDNMRNWNEQGGEVLLAKIGTTMPADDLVIPAEFESVGLISEAGIEESLEVESKDTKVWPGGRTVKKRNTSTTKSHKLVALEDSPLVTGLYYGHGKPTLVSGASAPKVARVDMPEVVPVIERACIIRLVDDAGFTRLKCIERIAIADRGTYVANTEDDPGYEFTMTETSKGHWLTNEPSYIEAAEAVTP